MAKLAGLASPETAMLGQIKRWAAAVAALVAVFGSGAAYAATCCNVPTTHQVRVPGVVVNRPAPGCGSNCCGSSCAPPPSCTQNCCTQNCGGGGFQGSFSFNASVSATAEAAARANVFANSAAYGLGGAINGSQGYGYGGSSFYVDYNAGYIPNLSVDEGASAVSVPYSATRTVVKVMVIQAVCIDDRAIPHPASQVTPDREIADAYEGELYRCLAGTRMQYTFAEYAGKVSFENGQTVTCQKNDALYREAGGKVACRPQKPARDCNERSLLRRYGAGVKIVKTIWTETYTAFRTEVRQMQAASAMGMVIDGGVGGVAH